MTVKTEKKGTDLFPANKYIPFSLPPFFNVESTDRRFFLLLVDYLNLRILSAKTITLIIYLAGVLSTG